MKTKPSAGLPAALVTIGPPGHRTGTCPTCRHALNWDEFSSMSQHNPPGCPMRVVRGRYAKDWTQEEWNAERAAHPEIRPWV